GLVAHDQAGGEWSWDAERVVAKGFTDNVVEFMIGKLVRLQETTRAALRELACLGNVTPISTLALVHGAGSDKATWEAVRAGLVFRGERTYSFLHDRVQEAAYGLIPERECAVEHLRIGRLLEASRTASEIADQIFEIADQKNRGAALIEDGAEKLALAR